MNEDHKQTINAVIRTLESVSVSGKENLNMLLASILALEKLLHDEPKQEG